MADTPLVAANSLTRFLAPLADLFQLRDDLLALASLDQAAAEAQGRIDDENRQVDTARAQLDALVQQQAVARDATAGIVAEANAQADKIRADAQDAARVWTDAHAAQDATAHFDAETLLAAVNADLAAKQTALAAANAACAEAEKRTADAQAQLAAIVAKLGA